MDLEELRKQVETLLFASPEPLSINAMKRALGEEDTKNIEGILTNLADEYNATKGLFIEKVQGGYQIFTKPAYDYIVKKLRDEERKYTISRAALEVLAIVSVFQPITKPEVESIRGIASDGVVKHLVDIELLRITGRLHAPGRPILYSTTPEFLKYFHLAAAEDLKTLYKKYSKEFDLPEKEERDIINEDTVDSNQDETPNGERHDS